MVKVLQHMPNDPNLIEKLSDKGVSISAAPIERNAFFSEFYYRGSLCFINCSMDFLYASNARW